MIALAPVVVALKPWQALAVTLSLMTLAAVALCVGIAFVVWLWRGE